MLMIFAFGAGIFLSSYLLTLLIGNILSIKNDILLPYQLKKDPYIYIFILIFTFFCVAYLLSYFFNDAIITPSFLWLGISFLFSGLIYFLFLLETDNLLNIGIVVFSLSAAFLFADKNILTTSFPAPWWLSSLGIGLIVSIITLGSRVLAGITGIFSLVMSILSLGLFSIACLGGIPSYLGLMAMVMFGVFSCVFQFNRFQLHLRINEGAMMSATFLFCMLLLGGVNELAGPSMLILSAYIIVEFLWSLCAQYILRKKETDLCFNTVYFTSLQKGVDLYVLYSLVLKVCIVNMVLSGFQLYAQNTFTLPILAFLIDFWLLSKLNNAGQEKTLKEVNQSFVESIKNEIGDIKQHFNKKD